MVQATIQFTDDSLSSIRRCYKRLSAVLDCVSRYYHRLSALICLAILQTTICCALLCLRILQATIQSTDYPLYHRLSNLPTIRSDLYGDTTNDYLLYSTLSQDTTSDYPIYRLSALPPTIRSDLYGDTTNGYLLYSTLSQDRVGGGVTSKTSGNSRLSLVAITFFSATDSKDGTICSTLLVDMLVVGGLVGVPFRRSPRWVSRRSCRAVSCLRSRRWVSRRS